MYIYRLRNAKTTEFTGDEALLGEEYSKLFKLIWRAKVKCLAIVFYFKVLIIKTNYVGDNSKTSKLVSMSRRLIDAKYESSDE